MTTATKAAKSVESADNRVRARDDVAARWVNVSELTAWAKNPRHNDAAVGPVAESLKRFGWGAPILARQANGEVVAGHTRLRAVELLATLVTSATDLDSWHPDALRSAREGMVPVRFGDWSERDAHLYALADNRLGELADWDAPVLTDLLGGYSLPEVEAAGWTSADLEEMAGAFDVPPGEFPEMGPMDGPQFKTISFTMTGDEHTAVMAALGRAGSASGKDAKTASLVKLCEAYDGS